MPEANLFEQVSAIVSKEIPGFSVQYKDQSKFMKILGLFTRLFNPDFMKRYITTIYPTVYFPNKEMIEKSPNRYADILGHEFVHLWDARRRYWSFTLGYLVPQIFAIPLLLLYFVLGSWIPAIPLFSGILLAVLACMIPSERVSRIVAILCFAVGILGYLALSVVFSGWFAFLAFAALVPLGPWPAPFRSASEYRGYAVDIAWRYWTSGNVGEDFSAYIVGIFTGFDYYRMGFTKERVEKMVGKIVSDCVSGDILNGEENKPYRLIHDLLKDNGMIHA